MKILVSKLNKTKNDPIVQMIMKKNHTINNRNTGSATFILRLINHPNHENIGLFGFGYNYNIQIRLRYKTYKICP